MVSVNYGNGINTGLDVLNDKEKISLEQQEKRVNEIKSAVEKLTQIRNDFDSLIRNVREVDFNKIDNNLRVEMMLEIQNTRDSVLDKIKGQLLKNL